MTLRLLLGMGCRDLVTREPRLFREVPMTQEKRQAIHHDRYAWPFEVSTVTGDGRVFVRLGGTNELELLEVDGLPVDLFCRRIRELRAERRLLRGDLASPLEVEISAGDFRGLYDVYCDVAGRSPGEELRLVLRDVATGKVFDSEEPRSGVR